MEAVETRYENPSDRRIAWCEFCDWVQEGETREEALDLAQGHKGLGGKHRCFLIPVQAMKNPGMWEQAKKQIRERKITWRNNPPLKDGEWGELEVAPGAPNPDGTIDIREEEADKHVCPGVEPVGSNSSYAVNSNSIYAKYPKPLPTTEEKINIIENYGVDKLNGRAILENNWQQIRESQLDLDKLTKKWKSTDPDQKIRTNAEDHFEFSSDSVLPKELSVTGLAKSENPTVAWRWKQDVDLSKSQKSDPPSERLFTCSLCGRLTSGFGHNPEPLKEITERCCDQCNKDKVIPVRLARNVAQGKTVTTQWKISTREEEGEKWTEPYSPQEPYEDNEEYAKYIHSVHTGTFAKNIEQSVEKNYPELMRGLYPRVYEEIGSYHSPKQCAAFLCAAIACTKEKGYGQVPKVFKLLLPALRPMIKRHMPLFFVSPSLFTALEHTDFPEAVNWPKLPLPYEEGIFILPRKIWSHDTNGEVSMLMWARYLDVEVGRHAFLLIAMCPNTGRWFHAVLRSKTGGNIRLGHLYEDFAVDEPYDKDRDFMEKLGTLTFGLFLAMNAEPQLVERGKCLRKIKKSDQVKEFWSPNVIGRRLRIQREDNLPQGTHASPRMHWRRGHIRQQRCGVKLTEIRPVFIKPVLVNALAASSTPK